MSKRSIISRPWLLAALLILVLCLAGHLAWQGWGAYHYRLAEQALERREFSAAQQHLNRCLGIWPRNPETLLAAAQAARRNGKTSDAHRLLAAAERAQAVPEAVVLERELLLMQTGGSSQADYYLQICESHPAAAPSPLIAEAAIVGGLQSLDLSQARRALVLWKAMSLGEEDRIQSEIWQGELAIRMGDVDTAITHFRRAVEADPANDASRLRLAELLTRPAPREALVHLEQLHGRRPVDRDVRLQLARCRRALGDHDEAARLLAKLGDDHPDDVPVLIEQGQVALDLEQVEAAERWLRRAETLEPERREVCVALARCLQLAGKLPEAQQYRDRLAGLDAQLDRRVKSMLEKGRLEP